VSPRRLHPLRAPKPALHVAQGHSVRFKSTSEPLHLYQFLCLPSLSHEASRSLAVTLPVDGLLALLTSALHLALSSAHSVAQAKDSLMLVFRASTASAQLSPYPDRSNLVLASVLRHAQAIPWRPVVQLPQPALLLDRSPLVKMLRSSSLCTDRRILLQ